MSFSKFNRNVNKINLAKKQTFFFKFKFQPHFELLTLYSIFVLKESILNDDDDGIRPGSLFPTLLLFNRKKTHPSPIERRALSVYMAVVVIHTYFVGAQLPC